MDGRSGGGVVFAERQEGLRESLGQLARLDVFRGRCEATGARVRLRGLRDKPGGEEEGGKCRLLTRSLGKSVDKVVFLCGRDAFKFLVEAEGKLDVVRQER